MPTQNGTLFFCSHAPVNVELRSWSCAHGPILLLAQDICSSWKSARTGGRSGTRTPSQARGLGGLWWRWRARAAEYSICQPRTSNHRPKTRRTLARPTSRRRHAYPRIAVPHSSSSRSIPSWTALLACLMFLLPYSTICNPLDIASNQRRPFSAPRSADILALLPTISIQLVSIVLTTRL